MLRINREIYLNQLVNKQNNGLVKIITGIRRCGKSFLLDPIFKEYLISEGVSENHIIKIDLDERRNNKYQDPDVLDEYIRSLIVDEETYYLLLDEVQKVDDFESVLNGFLHIRNLDIYVTGSNSKFLSSDIITEFRGRGDEIRVFPLSFSEYYSVFKGEKDEAWDEYITYGGLPKIVSINGENEKAKYLKQLFEKTYLSDIVERNNIQRIDIIDSILNILSSSIGSLTNPYKLLKTFQSNGVKNDLKHTLGVVSMARTSIKDSASSQFFICTADAPHLNGEYAAFGKVVGEESYKVLEELNQARTEFISNMFADFPYPIIKIKTIERI